MNRYAYNNNAISAEISGKRQLRKSSYQIPWCVDVNDVATAYVWRRGAFAKNYN